MRSMSSQLERDRMSEQDARGEGRAAMSAAISRAMVGLYKEQFGRGPTKTSTYWCSPDLITVTLEDTFTPAERSLQRMGEHHRLRDTRMFFQYATVREFCDPVERITGRRVRAFISGIDTEVDGLSLETFILHPEGSDAPSRAHRAVA